MLPFPRFRPAVRFARFSPPAAAAVAVTAVRGVGLTTAALLLGACASSSLQDLAGGGKASQVVISVADQKLTVVREGGGRTSYPISTSRFGLGDRRHSWTTPLGRMEIAQKIGGGAPAGAVFRSRVRTGEIVKVDAPGRDAIVTRILALRGLESGNLDAASRGIYIHGTPEERNIGRPVSYGCIRMRSQDIIRLYEMVTVGTKVYVLDSGQRGALASVGPGPAPARPASPAPVTAPRLTPAELATQVATAGGTKSAAPPTTPAAAIAAAAPANRPPAPSPAAPSPVAPSSALTPAPAPTVVASRRSPAASRPARRVHLADRRTLTAPAVADGTHSGNLNKHREWAGNPEKLLSTQTVAAASGSGKPGKGGGERGVIPVSNGPDTGASASTPAEGAPRHNLKRSALDSL